MLKPELHRLLEPLQLVRVRHLMIPNGLEGLSLLVNQLPMVLGP